MITNLFQTMITLLVCAALMKVILYKTWVGRSFLMCFKITSLLTKNIFIMTEQGYKYLKSKLDVVEEAEEQPLSDKVVNIADYRRKG